MRKRKLKRMLKVRLRVDHAELLRRWARDDGVTVSEFIRKLITVHDMMRRETHAMVDLQEAA